VNARVTNTDKNTVRVRAVCSFANRRKPQTELTKLTKQMLITDGLQAATSTYVRHASVRSVLFNSATKNEPRTGRVRTTYRTPALRTNSITNINTQDINIQ